MHGLRSLSPGLAKPSDSADIEASRPMPPQSPSARKRSPPWCFLRSRVDFIEHAVFAQQRYIEDNPGACRVHTASLFEDAVRNSSASHRSTSPSTFCRRDHFYRPCMASVGNAHEDAAAAHAGRYRHGKPHQKGDLTSTELPMLNHGLECLIRVD